MNSPAEEKIYRERLITEFRELLMSYGVNERLEILHAVTRDFCTACGAKLKPNEICHCENDE